MLTHSGLIPDAILVALVLAIIAYIVRDERAHRRYLAQRYGPERLRLTGDALSDLRKSVAGACYGSLIKHDDLTDLSAEQAQRLADRIVFGWLQRHKDLL